MFAKAVVSYCKEKRNLTAIIFKRSWKIEINCCLRVKRKYNLDNVIIINIMQIFLLWLNAYFGLVNAHAKRYR